MKAFQLLKSLLPVLFLACSCDNLPPNAGKFREEAIIRVDSIRVYIPGDRLNIPGERSTVCYFNILVFARMNNISKQVITLPSTVQAGCHEYSEYYWHMYIKIPHSDSKLRLHVMNCGELVLKPGQAILPWLQVDIEDVGPIYDKYKNASQILRQLESGAEVELVYKRNNQSERMDTIILLYRKKQ